MTTPANKVQGYYGTLTIGGTDYNVSKWSGKVEQEKLEITNMSSGGWREFIPGIKALEGSLEMVFDNVLNSGGAPFSSTAATFVLTTGGHSLSFSGYVFDINYDFDVNEIATAECGFSSTGVVTFA